MAGRGSMLQRWEHLYTHVLLLWKHLNTEQL
jgi:hypothetical protein